MPKAGPKIKLLNKHKDKIDEFIASNLDQSLEALQGHFEYLNEQAKQKLDPDYLAACLRYMQTEYARAKKREREEAFIL